MKARHGLFVFLTVLLFLNIHVYPAFATVIFSDGFESGNFSAWTGIERNQDGQPTVQSTVKHHGTYAMSDTLDSGGYYAFVYKDVTSGSNFYTRAYFRFSAVPTTSSEQFHMLMAMFRASDGFGGIELRVIYDSSAGYARFQARNNYFGSTFNGPRVVADTWYCVELHHTASGNEEWWVNGVSQGTVGEGAVSMNRFQIGMAHIGGSTAKTVYIDCVVVADTYIGPEEGAPTEYTFYGNIPLTFMLGSIKGFSFVRQGTIPLTFTFLSTITQAMTKNFYGSIPLTFSIESLKAITFNMFGSIPLTFTFEGTATFTHGILLNLYGTIPLTFTFESLKAINLNIFGSIPIQFAIDGIAQYITKHLFFYGTIPLQFILRHTISGLPEIAIDWGMAAMGMAIVAFVIAIVAFTTRKT